MKSTKHDEKKNEILEAAFRIWGACRYQNTSLSELASSLNLTKQALYRYFSSKEKLESEMEKKVVVLYIRFVENLLAKIQDLTGDDLIRGYTSFSLEFLRQNSTYLVFLVHRQRKNEIDDQTPNEYSKKLSSFVLHNSSLSGAGLRYLDVLIFQQLHRETESGKKDNESVSKLLEIWNNGLFTDRPPNSPDYNRILSDASRVDFSVFEKDAMARAVFEAVMEEAGSSVSLGKVARKAGLTKSSLYNYWPCKEAMLSDVFQKQANIYSSLFSAFVKKYSDMAEILFAYIAFFATFLRRTPILLNYLQRMMSFGVELPREEELRAGEFLSELRSLIDSPLVNKRHLEGGEILNLINFACLMEIKHHLTENSVRIRIEEGLKELHQLIAGGSHALRSIK